MTSQDSSDTMAVHPLQQFPLRRPILSEIWTAGERRALQPPVDNWLTCEGNTAFERCTAGLCTVDELRRNFRRFEGGGLFTSPGAERDAAARSLRAFDSHCRRDSDDASRSFVVVSKRDLHEVLSMEQKLRKERAALAVRCREVMLVDSCLGSTSLVVPSVAGTTALISLCAETERQCEAATRALGKKGGNEASRKSTIDEALELKTARLALRTGQWNAYRRKQARLATALERRRMATEDALARIVDRWTWAREQLADYRLYCELVAQYGVPYSVEEFERLGIAAGATFSARCDKAARAFQHMWRTRAPAWRLRRATAAKKVQRVVRGYRARRSWTPILHLRAECGVARPRKRSFLHWKVCVARTRRARELMRRVKYGNAATIVRAWRALTGDEASQMATSLALEAVTEALFAQYVSNVVDEWARSADVRVDELATAAADESALDGADWLLDLVAGLVASEQPDWMDETWFLRHTSYDCHIVLSRAGVLPDSIFARHRRRILERQAATAVQRRARGFFARERLRPRVAALFRKKRDDGAFYYLNVKTGDVRRDRPSIVGRLFPRSNF